MVGIVSGNGLGLFNTSLDTLGYNGGQTGLGQAGGSAFVNLATGNLAIQFADESMSGTGADLLALRTYNSLGSLNDGDADGWRWNGEKRIELVSGTKGSSGTVRRTTGDGSQTIYTWNSTTGGYLSQDGAGAHDVIKWNSSTSEWEFRQDNSSETVEFYNGTNGWIKRLQDSSGNRIDYTFSGDKLTKLVDNISGQTIEFIYGTSGNGNGKVVGINTRVTATGTAIRQVNYEYDSQGRLSAVKTDLSEDGSVSDGNIYTTTYTYQNSTSTRIASINQSDGTSVNFTYDGSNRIATVTDQTGVTTFTYSASSTAIKNGENQTWTYTFDSNKRLTSVSAPSVGGVIQKTNYSYDASGNVATVTDGKGKIITYTYDANGNRTKEVDSLGNTVTRTFSATNQALTETRYSVASATSPSGAETVRYVYDSSERLIFTISAEGRVSELRYNSRGLVERMYQYAGKVYNVSSLSATTALTASQLNSWVSGLTTTEKTQAQLSVLAYDAKGNLNKRTDYATVDTSGNGVLDAAASVNEFVYSEHGQLLQTIVARGSTRTTKTTLSSSVFDGMGRITSVVSAGTTITTSYSGTSITVANSASGLTVVSATDSRGRLQSVTQTDGSTNRITKYVYDNAGRLRMTEDPSGARAYTFYDAADRVSGVVDATGAAVVYSYDANGRVLTETTYFNTVNTSTWYNGTSVTVSTLSVTANTANDRKTTYTYDDAGRLKTTVVTGGLSTITNDYDGASRLVKTTQSTRITEYFYDKDGREIGSLDAEKYLSENIYDKAGRLIEVRRYANKITTVSNFATMKNEADNGSWLSSFVYYDAMGRKTGVVNDQGFLTEIIYDEVNNKQTTVQYMTAISAVSTDTLATAKTKAGSTKQSVVTAFDVYGRVSTVTSHDQTVSRNIYDTAGRLVRVIEAEGSTDQRATRTRFNAFGEVTGIVSGVGEATLSASATSAQINTAITNYGLTIQYDAAGRKVSEIGATESGKPQAKTFFFYNTAGQVTYTVNALGEVAQTTYNSFGQAATVRLYVTRISTANMGTITQGGSESLLSGKVSTNAADSILTREYNQLGLLSKTTDAENFITTYAYDGFGQLLDAYEGVVAGSTTNTIRSRNTYDLLGRVTEQYADYDGIRAQYSTRYDAFSRVTQTIDANRKTTNFAYANNGRVVTITDPTSRTRKTEVDAYGRVVKSYDGYNKVTMFTYDDANRKLTVTNPDNSTIVTIKTRTGETLQVTDARNNVVKYAYTKDGQLDTVTDADNRVILNNNYDRSGRLYETTDGNGVVTRYSYDAANRVILRQVDPTGLDLRVAYTFDGQGRQIKVVEGSGSDSRETQYVYDKKGQIKQIIVDPATLKLSTRFTYDGQGNTLKIERGKTDDPAQQVTDITFDKLGRKTKEVVDPAGLKITTQYFYDKNGNLTRVTDPNNNSAWFIYDAAGNKTHSIDSLGGVTVSSYDKNGRAYHVRQYANVTSSLASLATNNAPTSITLPTASTDDRRTYNVYDDMGRLVYSLQAKDASSWVVSESRYDANGNVVKLIAYDKTITEANINTMTASGSTEAAEITAAEVAAQITALGYTSSNSGNARITEYVYDKHNRQIKTILAGWYDKTDGVVYNTQASQSDRFQRTIEVAYDVMGNAISNKIKIGTGTGDYIYQYKTYDKAGRETFSVDGLGFVSGKTYDALGQVKTISRYASGVTVKTSGSWTDSELKAASQIATGAKRTISFTYDKAGRELTVSQPTGGLVTNTYDDLGNLIKRSQKLSTTANDNADTYFYYDKANRQVMVVDALKYITTTEYDAAGNARKVREYATAYGGALTTKPTSIPTNSKDRITEYVYDALGQVTSTKRALFDNISTLQETTRSQYNNFGEVITNTEEFGSADNVTSVKYDRLGQTIEITEPGRVVASTGVNGFTSTVTATPITTITYNAFGESIKEERKTSAGAGQTIVIEHQFDIAGNETGTKDGNGRWSYSAYDVSGKVIRQTLAISVTDAPDTIDYTYTMETRYEYDKAGRQISSVDIYDGKQTGQVNVYNGFGDVTEERKVWGAATASISSLMSTATSNVLVATYAYHANGQLNYKRSKDGYVYFKYDLADRVTETNQRETTTSTTADRVTKSTYDKLGRVTTQIMPLFSATTGFGNQTVSSKTPTITRSYDRWNNVLTETGDTVGVTRTYNQDDQILTEERVAVDRINFNSNYASTRVVRQFTYDKLGRMLVEKQTAYEGTTEIASRNVVTNTYNAAGQVTRTLDAMNVDTDYVYDIHGNKVASRAATNHVTTFAYDKNNQLIQRNILRVGTTGEYTGSGTPTAVKLASYKYDQAGRKYAEGDSNNSYDYYKFDARGNIVVQRARAGGERKFVFDELNNKTEEQKQTSYVYDSDPSPYGTNYVTVVNTETLRAWSYKNSAGTDFVDYKSDLTQRLTVAGTTYSYEYNNQGQLLREKVGSSVRVTYDYWQNGLQKSISETNTVGNTTTTNTSTFYYDVRGNKTVDFNNTKFNIAAHTETGYGGTTYTVPASSTDTGNFYTYFKYDAHNRVTEVKSPQTSVKIGSSSYNTTNLQSLKYDYDEWGNRRRIQGLWVGISSPRNEWYSYDKADRVLIEAGGTNGSAVTRGTGKEYSYDVAGRRVKEFVSQTTKEYRSGTYGETYLGSSTIKTDRLYNYNDLGLVSLTRMQVVESGYVNTTNTSNEFGYTYDNRGFKTKEIQYKKDRTVDNVYNADGTLTNSTTKVTSNSRKESYIINRYDSYGEMSSYTYYLYDITKSNTPEKFHNDYGYNYINTYSGRQVSSISVTSSQSNTGVGTTYNSYDSRGRLTSARITESGSGNTAGTSYRYFGYNASGQIIGRYEKKFGTSTYKIQNFYYAPQGGELANLGGDGYNISPLSAIAGGGNTPGTYTVNSGDTLMGIATMLFGDAKLWYLIADANGLNMGPTDAFSPGDVGRNLRIPNNDKTISNTSNNWKPYNPTEIIGDLTPDPTILPPPKKKGCGIIAIIIMVVVAVVLTVVTAGAAAVAMGATGGLWSAGAAALGGTLAGATAGAAATAAAMGAAFVGGFVGSLGSQLVGKAMGVVDKVSFRTAFASGLTAGFTAGAGSYLQSVGNGALAAKNAQGAVTGLNWYGRMAQGATSYLGSYASNKIAGLDASFNWKDLAVSAVSSSITGSSGNKTADAAKNAGKGFASNFARNMFSSAVSSSLSRLVGRGQKQDWAAMSADAFGNAVASSIVNKMVTRDRAIGQIQEKLREAADPNANATDKQLRNLASRIYGDGLEQGSAFDRKELLLDVIGTLSGADPEVALAEFESLGLDAVVSEADVYSKKTGGPKYTVEVIEYLVGPAYKEVEGKLVNYETGKSAPEELQKFVTSDADIQVDASVSKVQVAKLSETDQILKKIILKAEPTLSAVGGAMSKLSEYTEGSWALKVGMVALDIAAGPVAFAVRTAVNMSPLGKMISDASEALMNMATDFIVEKTGMSAVKAAGMTLGFIGLATIAFAGAKTLLNNLKSLRKASDILINQRKVGPHTIGNYRAGPDPVKGHHPHSQAARSNDPNYDPNKAIAMKDDGTFDHDAVTKAQRESYQQVIKDGKTLDAKLEDKIEVNALVKGGVKRSDAVKIVKVSRENLNAQGASVNPTRTPYTRKGQ